MTRDNAALAQAVADKVNMSKKKPAITTIAIIVVLCLIIGTWTVIVVSWFLRGEYPAGLATFTQWLTAALLGQSSFICIEKCVEYYNQNGRGEGGGVCDN